jgi:hypothetical protein
MNKHDRSNLNFLLTVDPNTLKSWYQTSTHDDIVYATELLNQYQLELDELKIEQQVKLSENDPLGAYAIANSILSKFRV